MIESHYLDQAISFATTALAAKPRMESTNQITKPLTALTVRGFFVPVGKDEHMNKRTCNVEECANEVGRSGAKGFCSNHYKRFRKYGDPLGSAPKKPHRTCISPDCASKSRTPQSELCPKHYHRRYRHGSAEMTSRSVSIHEAQGKYRIVEMPSHAVASPCGKAYEHRVVLYDSIGDGDHACHWCSSIVSWRLPSTDPNGLQVDHLNRVRDDNRLENLVPSCGKCNTGRASQERSDILRQQGFWSVNDTIDRLRDPAQRRVKRVLLADSTCG